MGAPGALATDLLIDFGLSLPTLKRGAHELCAYGAWDVAGVITIGGSSSQSGFAGSHPSTMRLWMDGAPGVENVRCRMAGAKSPLRLQALLARLKPCPCYKALSIGFFTKLSSHVLLQSFLGTSSSAN